MEDKSNIESLINLIDNPCEFYRQLSSIRDDSKLIETCQNLNEKLEIDYFKLALEAIQSRHDVFFVSHVIEKIAFLSILNLDSILTLYERLYTEMSGDLANFTQYEITKNICQNHKDFSFTLLKALQEIEQDYVTYHISTILLVLHNDYNLDQYGNIKKYLENTTDKNKTLASIEAISKIDLTDELQSEILDIFNKIIDLNNESYSSSIVHCISRMKDKYKELKTIFLELSKTEYKNVKFNLSQILMFNKGDEVNEEWYQRCLFSLTDTMTDELGIVNNFSHIFENILDTTNDYRTILDFFIKWLESSDISANFPNKSFEHFIHSFFSKHEDLYSKFITKVFNMENMNLHTIISRLMIKKSSFDNELLNQYTDQDILFMCRKVLGYFYDFEALKNLIWSISYKKNLSKNSQGILIDIFINHIGVDYPYNALKFFKDLKQKDLTSSQKNIKKQVLQSIEKTRIEYQSLDRLKELTPPSQEVREINKANQFSISESIKESQEDSIFSQIATKIPIKYGKGHFYNIDGQYTQPSYMQKISTEMSFPVSENAHPISSAIDRFYFRIAKKGDV
jgi:hypothetical protein